MAWNIDGIFWGHWKSNWVVFWLEHQWIGTETCNLQDSQHWADYQWIMNNGTLHSSRKYPFLPQGGLLEILRGIGVFCQNVQMKAGIFRGVGGFKPKPSVGGVWIFCRTTHWERQHSRFSIESTSSLTVKW